MKLSLEVPLNRVEGDLEIRVEVEHGVVVDAWSTAPQFRGLESVLRGRGARDGLVIGPRICGLCSSAHLFTAAAALDEIAEVQVAPHGLRARNVALMAENIQNDLRHGFLMYLVDFTSPAHARRSLYEEAVRRHRPFAGESWLATLRASKLLPEVIAILGGQWPHSSFMVPGGVASLPSPTDLARARQIVTLTRRFYEERVLGCSLERWSAVDSAAKLDAWLDERPAHRDSEVGFFLRFSREAGLDRIGRGTARFLSFGAHQIAEGSAVRARGGDHLVPAGLAIDGEVRALDAAKIAEHVASSWYVDHEGGRHPLEGETRPYASGREGKKYSWVKAPRYDGEPAEVGPLSQAMVARDPLFFDLVRRDGASAMVRELARLVRGATLLPAMDTWLSEIATQPGRSCAPDVVVGDGIGAGLTEAARGALGHWVVVENERIVRYQVITPTAWNGSPRCSAGLRGPWEEALVGTPIEDPEDPVAIGHVVRSFDPCQSCTVHAVDARTGAPQRRFRV